MSWEMVKFSNAVNDITGGNRKFLGSEYLLKGEFPIIDQGENLIGGYTNTSAVVKRTKPVIIFGDHTKSLKYVDFNFCLGADGVKVLEPIDEINSKFLYYYLLIQKLPNVGYSRHFKFLKEIKIPLPPLSTQKRIAEILDKADALRKKDQQLLKYYDDLAQSLFIDLFGDPVKNEKGWEVKNGKQIFSLLGGAAFKSSEYEEAGIPLIRIGAVNKGYFDKSQLTFLPDNFEQRFKKYLVYPKDLLMTLTGTVGKEDYGNPFTLRNEFDRYFLNQRVAKITVPEEFDLVFFEYFFKQKSIKNQLIGVSRGVRQANISNEDFYKLKVIIPPISLQNQFATQIQNIEQQKERLKIQIQASEHLFQALLKQAFNGGLAV